MTQLQSIDVAPQTWGVMREQASALLKSGFLPSAIKSPEQAVAIMLKGREIGIPAMQSLAQINVIQGKPTISAELMLALIYRAFPAAKITFKKLDNESCVIEACRPGGEPQTFSFSMDDAKAASLTSKDNWKKYARAMLRSRAVSEMARSLFPDAIAGCSYTPEELGAEVDDDGSVISITPETSEPKQTKPKVTEMAAEQSDKTQLKARQDKFEKFMLGLAASGEYDEFEVLNAAGLEPDYKASELTNEQITKALLGLKTLKKAQKDG
jgi:hypothetical protein